MRSSNELEELNEHVEYLGTTIRPSKRSACSFVSVCLTFRRSALRRVSRVFTESSLFSDSSNFGAFDALSETPPPHVVLMPAAETPEPVLQPATPSSSECDSVPSSPCPPRTQKSSSRILASRDDSSSRVSLSHEFDMVDEKSLHREESDLSPLRSFSNSLRSQSAEFISSVAFKTRKLGARSYTVV